jgi:hypothetical protein
LVASGFGEGRTETVGGLFVLSSQSSRGTGPGRELHSAGGAQEILVFALHQGSDIDRLVFGVGQVDARASREM